MAFCLAALQVPVLVRHPSTKELYVNLDPAVHTVVRESEWMRKLGLEIPDSAGIMTYLRNSLKNNFDQLSVRIFFTVHFNEFSYRLFWRIPEDFYITPFSCLWKRTRQLQIPFRPYSSHSCSKELTRWMPPSAQAWSPWHGLQWIWNSTSPKSDTSLQG